MLQQIFPARLPVRVAISAADAPLEFDDDSLLALYGAAQHGDSSQASTWLSFNFVSSLDGASSVQGLSGALGNATDQRIFALLRRPAQAILLGAGTIRAEGYGGELLNVEARKWRLDRRLPERPRLVIFSGTLDLDPSLEVFANAPEKPLVLTTQAATQAKRDALAHVADVVLVEPNPGRGDKEAEGLAHALLRTLHERGFSQVHCEGGPSLLGTFVSEGLVDELALTISPLLAAGPAGRIAHSPEQGDIEQLKLAHVLEENSTLFLRYVRP